MNEFFKIDLSKLSLVNMLGLVIFGAFVYLLMVVFKKYLVHLIIKSPLKRKNLIAKLPVVYTLVWILFVLYALYIFIAPFPFFGIILSLVFVYLGRGYLVNLIHGLFFRLKGDINLGQKLALDDYSGVVYRMNVFDLEIQNKEGEIIQIPYGNMARKEIIKKDFSTDFSTYKFSLIMSAEVTEEMIKTKILQMPWVTNVFKPKVSKVMQSEDVVNYDIIVYPLDEKFNVYIENDLKTEFVSTQKSR